MVETGTKLVPVAVVSICNTALPLFLHKLRTVCFAWRDHSCTRPAASLLFSTEQNINNSFSHVLNQPFTRQTVLKVPWELINNGCEGMCLLSFL